MNRFLALATALPVSVAFTSGVNAAEVSPALIEVPVLSVKTKPDSAITFTQREGLSPRKVARPLVITSPLRPSATPIPQIIPLPQATVEPVALKTVAPQPAASKTPVAAPLSTPPALSAQAKTALEIEMRLPVYVVKKPVTRSTTTVALTPSQPEAKPVEIARPLVSSPVVTSKPVPAIAKGVDKEDKKLAVKETPKVAAPARLASREARAQQLLLARLDADLAKAERNLQRSETRLSDGQRQLGSINNIIKSAMVGLGDEGKGLHPFVRVAQRYLGTPYVWGGESARGFDCSGFIMRVMRDLGYKALPHSAAEQFRYGTPIAKPLLKAGDIVFFANTYKRGVSHVGIYLGRGRFIHAANSQDGTIVSDLNSAKWTAHYAGARRLVSQ